MQNVAQGSVSDSDKDNSSQNSESNLALGDKCKTYAELQEKFCSSSAESESEEEELSEVLKY